MSANPATSASTARFNAEAAAWDSNPVTVRSSELAYETLLRYVPDLQTSKPDILEIGCGTGLLSFHLAPRARSLLGVDLAAGMVAAFNAKVAAAAAATPGGGAFANARAVETLLTEPDQPEVQDAAKALLLRRGGSDGGDGDAGVVRWDLVVSHLTLHHVPDVAAVLRTCWACLRPGGRIALTDFEEGEEAVLFHPRSKREGVERHGIGAGEVGRLIEGAGFVDVRVERAFVLEKEVDPEEAGGRAKMGFPFLVCLGRRPE